MTDQEKIMHYENIEFLRPRIGGCFGAADRIFAGHPADESRAKELRKLAADNQISLAEIQELALGYLYREGVLAEHIKKQTEKVTTFFSKKLT